MTVYRAHRDNELDWIVYKLDKKIAECFSRERASSEVKTYKVKKSDVLAYFTRREE